ncbi:MAG: S8 family serine peptidase [Candidatus Kaelpia imicola]|nr:S8 family serine peptidase [Candidatus Kaelpia imicola]
MAKRVFVVFSLLVLLSVSAFASTVFIIDSTYNGHGYEVRNIIQERAPDADVIFKNWTYSENGNKKYFNSRYFSNADLISAIEDVIDKVESDSKLRNEGVVLNLSLGSSHYSQSLANAIKDAQDAGIVVVAAAGNDGPYSTNYPAALPGVISVGALEYDYRSKRYIAAEYSGLGKVWAPAKYAGTSFSSPHVAGDIANLMDKNDIGAYEASRIILNNDRNNNKVVGLPNITVSKPFSRTPKQIVSDSEIVYRLFAFLLVRSIFMDRFNPNFVKSIFVPFSRKGEAEINPSRPIIIPRSGSERRFSPYIYNGRGVSGRFF